MNTQETQAVHEIRKSIDLIDENIIKLMAARNEKIKLYFGLHVKPEEAHSQERLQEVADHVRAKAIKLGLSPNLVDTIFQTMIMKMVEMDLAELVHTKMC